MKKKLFFLITSFLLVGVVFASYSHNTASAQVPTTGAPVKSNQSWSCLSSLKPVGEIRESKQKVLLTGNCDSQDNQCYIAACVSTPTGTRCTTGNNAYDSELNWGTNNYTQMQTADIHFIFEVVGGSKLQTTDGAINVAVYILAGGDINWTFHAIGTNHTQIVNPEGDASSLEYGTFGFEGDTTCNTYRADPYGVVFDSQSLEPLPGVSVTLNDTNKAMFKLVGVPNPVKTIADGVFNFVVPSGTYYLGIAPRSGYSFTDQSFIHPNYIKAYADLYKVDEPINEDAATPEHRDVALNPGVNAPYHAEPVNLTYSTLQLGDMYKVSGKQSHPLTIVSFKQGEKEIATTTANKYGYYDLSIQNGLISPDTNIDVFLTKVDLTATEQTAQPQKAISFEPQPPYVEGKATTKSGTPIPSAQVKVKLKTSGETYYQTTADASGVFTVPPKSTPVLPYYLEFTPPNSFTTTKMTTTEFATINKDYLATNNVNLMTATKNGTPLIAERKKAPETTGTAQQNVTTTNLPLDNNNGQPVATNNNALVIGLLVFFILFVLGAGIYIYMKQKNQVTGDMPPPQSPPQELT